jgi:fatty-acyl-CoA synthase
MAERALGQMLVGNILATAAIRYGDKEAFYCSGTQRRFSFRQTNERCNRLANALTGLGLAKGDVVAFLCTNRVEIVEIFFALARTGIIGIPLNYRLAPLEIVELMRSLGAKAMLTERRFNGVQQRVFDELSQVTVHVSFGEEPLLHGYDYEYLLAAASAGEPDLDVDESAPYYYNLTSGTTGLPKCYGITQFNNCSMGPWFQVMEISSRDVAMTVFPIFGRVGFSWAVYSVSYGVRNVLANFEPDRVLRLIEAERVTITNLVPTMGAMLVASSKLTSHDLSSLRALVFAGSMLAAPVRGAVMEKLCHRIFEYYGMQEAGTLVVSTPEDRLRRSDSVGRAIQFVELKIAGPDGKPLAAGELGEIVARGPQIVTGYFQNPEKTAETFRNGWLHTGDLGWLDDEGFLFISGRKKDLIVTGGQNVHPAEVEDLILAMEGVADCAVIGLPDSLWGERVTAVVVLMGVANITGEDVIRQCRQRLAGFKTPKEVLFQTEPLPRTPTGKVQKFILVERHRSGS